MSSSGPAQHEASVAFGQVNLLAERIIAHEANRRKSLANLRAMALLLALAATLVPYLAATALRLEREVADRGKAAAAAGARADGAETRVEDLAPAISYTDRQTVSRDHLKRWRALLSILEAGTGEGGFVSHVDMRILPGAMQITVHGEAPSLAAANRLGASLRDRPATRDLRLVSVRPAEVMNAQSGAVQYEVNGKMKLK